MVIIVKNNILTIFYIELDIKLRSKHSKWVPTYDKINVPDAFSSDSSSLLVRKFPKTLFKNIL